MIKKLISAAIMMTALTAWVSAASAAELYISSDTTDKYNEYEKLVNEYFSEIDEYRKLSDFEITGKYDFSDTGINFSGNEKSSLMINKELGDDYVINTCVTAENGVRVIYSYIDESNYAYLESDSTLSDCDIRLAEVKNGVQSVIASGSIGKLSEIKTSVGDGKINVSCIFDGTVTEVFSEVPVSVTGGKAGLEFVSASGSVKLIEVWQKREECYNGSIDGCIVSYENLGKCTFIAAFYNNGTLDSVYSTEVNITDKGNNYISLPINNIHSLQGLEQKFFLFDRMDTE